MKTCLYRHFDSSDQLLYVGISLQPISRLSQHHRNAGWVEDISRVSMEWFPSRDEALAAEKRAIKTELPLHNKVHAVGMLDAKEKEKLARQKLLNEEHERRVVVANALKGVSLRTAKLFFMLLDAVKVNINDHPYKSIFFSDLNKRFHVTKAELSTAFEELERTQIGISRDIEIEYPEYVKFRFSKDLRRILLDRISRQFLLNSEVLSFRSSYTMNLYTFLWLRSSKKDSAGNTLTLDQLREVMGVPDGKLPDWSELRTCVMEQAKGEINQLTGFQFDYHPHKFRRKVDRISFFCLREDRDMRKKYEKVVKPDEGHLVESSEHLDLWVTGPLTIQDRNVFNALVENAHGQTFGQANAGFTIQTSRLLEYVPSADRLSESLTRLQKTIVKAQNGNEVERTQLLGRTQWSTAGIDGALKYNFTDELFGLLKNARVLDQLDLAA